MTSLEEREKRRKKIRRDSIKKDLHTPKYRQRKLPKRRKGGRRDRQTDEDLLVDDGITVYIVADNIDRD